MSMDFFDKDDVLKFIRQNYQLANNDIPDNFKSAHWDIFNKNFDRLFDLRFAWDRMLRNALTLGFNDTLLGITNRRFSEKKEDLWTQLQSGDIKDLVTNTTDKKMIEEQKKVIQSNNCCN